jgi:uncharacterized protein YkwD
VRRTTVRPLRRLVVTGFVLAGSALGGTAAVAAASTCAPSSAGTAGTMTLAEVRAGTRCLLNEKRAAHGLRALKFDRRLTRTARRHSRDMVAETYFAHDSLSGQRFSGRIAATGWMHGRERWMVGENLAWGAGLRATPHAIMKAWMQSAAHRRNILQPRFRVLGVGVERGTPVAGQRDGITYTTDFGS